MRLPAPLSRRKADAHKNEFGHVFVLAGSARMLGAAALCGLGAMRTGAGLVTVGVPESLNIALQSKVSNVIMTLPLHETAGHAIASSAYPQVKKIFSKYQSVAIGPGMGQEPGTKKFILKMIAECPLPVAVDADALNILSSDLKVLGRARGPRVLTPHPGEMARLTGLSSRSIEEDRLKIARDFAVKNGCVLLLKGQHTCVASASGATYINRTGNSGMATAGSGDVLTGMIAALLAQGVEPFQSAKTACYLHGLAGDAAAKKIGKVSLTASDIIESIPHVLIKGKR